MDITIGIAELPPGKTVTTARIICQAMSLNCSFRPFNGTDYGDGLDNGTGTGMIGAVQRGEFDTFEPLFTPTVRRFKAVDFSDPLFYADILLVTRAPKEQKNAFSLDIVSALRWETWLTFTAALLLTAAFISLLSKRKIRHGVPAQSEFHWFIDIFFYLPALITHKHRPKKYLVHHFVRLAIISWSFSAMVLSSAYIAILFSEKLRATASLPYTDFESFITCLEDGRCRIIIKSMNVSFTQILFASEHSLGQRAQKAFAQWPPLIVSPISAIRNQILQDQSTFLVWIGSRGTYVANFKTKETCPFYVVEAPYREAWTFPVRKNSALKKILDKAAASFTENGLNQGVSAHFENGTVCYHGQYSMVGGTLTDSSTINAALCFLAGGVLIGVLGLILELAWKKWKGRQEESDNRSI